MHRTEVKAFRGNVGTHLDRLTFIARSQGEPPPPVLDESTYPLVKRCWLSYGLGGRFNREHWTRLAKFFAQLSDTLWIWLLVIPALAAFLRATLPALLESHLFTLVAGLGVVGIVALRVFDVIHRDVRRP